MKITKVFLFFILLAFFFSCKKKESSEPSSNNTTTQALIDSIKADRTYTKSGLSVQIWVVVHASAPQYKWETTSGTILTDSADPSKATYYPCASCAGGTTTISCTVTDGSRSEKKSIDIEVQK